jgi:hypothetical protein
MGMYRYERSEVFSDETVEVSVIAKKYLTGTGLKYKQTISVDKSPEKGPRKLPVGSIVMNTNIYKQLMIPHFPFRSESM